MKSSDKKKFDLIIFGATGFTGKLLCEYIKKKYSKNNLNWGIAGRNKQKLALLKEKLTMDDKHVFFANILKTSNMFCIFLRKTHVFLSS